MNELMNQIIPTLTTVLITVLVAFIGYVGKVIVKFVPMVIDFIVAKVGITNYQKSKLVACDIWNVIEEHFRVNEIIGDTVQAKVIMFETLIKQKIPGITNREIELVRQAIAGEINKDKSAVIKAIEQPIEVVPAIVKYFAPDGVTELQPVPKIEASTELSIAQ